MKIGCIVVGRNMEEYVEPCLAPWIEARKKSLDGNEFFICAASAPFVGFPTGAQDRTVEKLSFYQHEEDIDGLLVKDNPLTEIQVRGEALRNLVQMGADTIVQIDLDEIWTLDEISRVFKFVKSEPLVAWFKVCYKNFVFDDKTWLIDPFTPPRIYRVKVGGYRVHSFSDDNNILYGGMLTRDLKRDEDFAHLTIPTGIAFVRHLSWLSNERSRQKISYQNARGWQCSFAWDESKGLIFNPAYYGSRPFPRLGHDSP